MSHLALLDVEEVVEQAIGQVSGLRLWVYGHAELLIAKPDTVYWADDDRCSGSEGFKQLTQYRCTVLFRQASIISSMWMRRSTTL